MGGSEVQRHLHLNDQDLRIFADAIPHVVWMADADGSIEFLNSFGREYGIPPEAADGFRVFDLIHPDDRDGARAGVARALLTAEHHVQEFRLRRVDGSYRWMSVRARPLHADGTVRRWIGTCTDIEEQKQLEEELRTADRRSAETVALVEAIQASAPIGFAFVDRSFRFMRVNPTLAAINGLPASEHVGRPVADVLPELWPALEPIYRHVLENAEPVVNIDVAGTTPASEGDERSWLASYYPVCLRDEVIGVGALVNDITDRKRLERALLEAHRETAQTLTLLETIQSSAPIGFAYVDRDLRLVRVNDAVATWVGVPADELVGRTVTEALPAQATRFEPLLRDVLASGEANVGIEVPGTLDPERSFVVNHYPVRVQDEIAGVGVIVSDVTERRALEERMRHMQKMDAVGSLASGIAHDFNNLIGAITAFASLIVGSDGAGEDARADAEEILRASERATQLTSQLLAFSRQQPSVAEPVDLNAAVHAMETFLRRLLGSNVSLSTRLADDAGNVLVDPHQLEQVIVNLAVNARDAMPGGGRLLVETQPVTITDPLRGGHLDAQPGRYVRLSVADTGIGIDAHTRPRLFEPFFTTKPTGEGTGLGLATVYGIVAGAGGELRVLSEQNEGARFEIYLPATDRPVAAELDRRQVRGGHETVLLVDDDDDLRRATRRLLEDLGYQVLEAETGEKALDCFRDAGPRIDAVIADIVMPDMSGIALSTGIRSRRADAVVVLTSDRSPRAFHGPVLRKPFSREQLDDCLRRALKARASVGS